MESDNDTVSLVIFPGAGSFGSEFRPLLKAFRPKARLQRYSWRYGEARSQKNKTFNDAAWLCAQQIQKSAHEQTVFIGHSFGAFMAYATALALQEVNKAPIGLILTGASAPDHTKIAPKPVTETEIESYWNRVDPGMFDRVPDQSWKDLLIETTRRDLALLESLRDSRFGRLSCPLYIGIGDTDPLVSGTECKRWAGLVEGNFDYQSFRGGHSDFLITDEFIEWVGTATTKIKGANYVSG